MDCDLSRPVLFKSTTLGLSATFWQKSPSKVLGVCTFKKHRPKAISTTFGKVADRGSVLFYFFKSTDPRPLGRISSTFDLVLVLGF